MKFNSTGIPFSFLSPYIWYDIKWDGRSINCYLAFNGPKERDKYLKEVFDDS